MVSERTGTIITERPRDHLSRLVVRGDSVVNTSEAPVFLPNREQGIACPAIDPDLLLGVGGPFDSQTRMEWNWGQFSRINDFEVFKGTPQAQSVLDLLKDSQNLVVLLMVMIYYSKRIQIKMSKR